MRKVLALSIMMLAIIALPASAQWGAGQKGPQFRGDFKPVVGAWAEYQVKAQGMAPYRMKMAVVAKEGNAFWYETVTDGPGGRSIMKMLVSGDPSDQTSVKRMIMKHGSEPAMEMPVMGGQQQAGVQDPKVKMVDKGMEKVTVPAGTFTARRLQYQVEKDVVDSWVAEKVSPYGLVKSAGRDFEMQLTGYGTGAKTGITETPKKFQMPKMPAGMPKGMMPPGMEMPGED